MTSFISPSPTRRDVLMLMGSFAALAATSALAAPTDVKKTTVPKNDDSGFRATQVVRNGHRIYVCDYPGSAPTFVMAHGFPDNCQIYKEIAPRLSAAGRRVVAFDFLGFGRSDKPTDLSYSFDEQVEEMTAVVDGLRLQAVIPVGHDAGGPAAVNYAISNVDRVAGLALMNCFYSNDPSRAFPDFIELCCNPKTLKLAHAMMTDPQMAGYLFQFQQDLLMKNMPADLREKFLKQTRPIIATNFEQQPSAMPAFLKMTGNAYANLDANDRRLPELAKFQKPVSLIWGAWDKYLSTSLAREIAGHFPRAQVIELQAEHWPQLDRPEEVTEALLALA